MAVFMMSMPMRSQRSSALRPSFSPSLVVRSEWPRERDRHEAELVHHPLDAAERLGIGFERHVLGPAAHRGELDIFVARRGDALERLFEAVGVIAVGVAAKPVLQCHCCPRIISKGRGLRSGSGRSGTILLEARSLGNVQPDGHRYARCAWRPVTCSMHALPFSTGVTFENYCSGINAIRRLYGIFLSRLGSCYCSTARSRKGNNRPLLEAWCARSGGKDDTNAGSASNQGRRTVRAC